MARKSPVTPKVPEVPVVESEAKVPEVPVVESELEYGKPVKVKNAGGKEFTVTYSYFLAHQDSLEVLN